MSYQKSLIMGLFAYFAISVVLLAADRNEPHALIIQTEGSGVAKIKKRSGIEIVIGKNTELYSGDRLITDGKIVANVALVDGTLFRVAPNTEFKPELIENKIDHFQWTFSLFRGGIRVLTEKSWTKNEFRSLVNTPSASLQAEDLDAVLEYEPKTASKEGTTKLYVIAGTAKFGSQECSKKNNCITIAAKTGAELARNAKAIIAGKPTPLVKYLQETESAKGQKVSLRKMPAILIFGETGLKKLEPQLQIGINDDELMKFADKAVAEFSSLQDQFLSRSMDQRLRYYQSITGGTYPLFRKMSLSILPAKDPIQSAYAATYSKQQVPESAAIEVRRYTALEKIMALPYIRKALEDQMKRQKLKSLSNLSEAQLKTFMDGFATPALIERINGDNRIYPELNSLRWMEGNVLGASREGLGACCTYCLQCQSDPGFLESQKDSKGEKFLDGEGWKAVGKKSTFSPTGPIMISETGDCFQEGETCENSTAKGCDPKLKNCKPERKCTPMRKRVPCK